jgi:HEAT repeat protein
MAALRVLDPEPIDVQPVLAAALTNKDRDVRHWAVNGLGEIALGIDQSLAQQAAARLIAALEDREASVRQEAAAALGAVGEQARSAVAGLLALLKDAEGTVRLEAAKALGSIAPGEARQAVPELILALPARESGRRLAGHERDSSVCFSCGRGVGLGIAQGGR